MRFGGPSNSRLIPYEQDASGNGHLPSGTDVEPFGQINGKSDASQLDGLKSLCFAAQDWSERSVGFDTSGFGGGCPANWQEARFSSGRPTAFPLALP